MSCDLYRHFDGDGTLLYVGISLSAMGRLSGHRHHSEWFELIRTVTIEKYPSREEAEEAEKRAVLTERPVYNIAHSLSSVQYHWPRVFKSLEGGKYENLESLAVDLNIPDEALKEIFGKLKYGMTETGCAGILSVFHEFKNHVKFYKAKQRVNTRRYLSPREINEMSISPWRLHDFGGALNFSVRHPDENFTLYRSDVRRIAAARNVKTRNKGT